MRHVLDATTIVGVIGFGLVSIHTLSGSAAVPCEVVVLDIDVEPDQVNFSNLAVFVKELDLVPESFLSSSDKVIMQYWRWDAVSTIHDWEPESKGFLLYLTIRVNFLHTTRGVATVSSS